MNNSNYTVIHSKDPWLLARLSTDLMMEGIGSSDVNRCDFGERRNARWDQDFKWIAVNSNYFGFHSHECVPSLKRFDFTLTESNYLQVLTTIIERHGK